jgi:alpha-beta hydrolase superfamily lysophospholipase
MQATTFGFERPDGAVLFVYRWLPNGPAKAVVQIAHGWGEHAGRYARVAEALHRGHGRTARTPAELGFFAERDRWNTTDTEHLRYDASARC